MLSATSPVPSLKLKPITSECGFPFTTKHYCYIWQNPSRRPQEIRRYAPSSTPISYYSLAATKKKLQKRMPESKENVSFMSSKSYFLCNALKHLQKTEHPNNIIIYSNPSKSCTHAVIALKLKKLLKWSGEESNRAAVIWERARGFLNIRTDSISKVCDFKWEADFC